MLLLPVQHVNDTFSYSGPQGSGAGNQNGTFNDLPPGEYTITYNSWADAMSYQYTLNVGYEMDWEANSFWPFMCSSLWWNVAGLQNTGSVNQLTSINALFPNNDGWIEFDLGCGSNLINYNAGDFMVRLGEGNGSGTFVHYGSYNWTLGYVDNGFFDGQPMGSPQLQWARYARIERNATGYRFELKNDAGQVVESADLTSLGPVGASLENVQVFAADARILNARASFRCPMRQYARLQKFVDGGSYNAVSSEQGAHVYFLFNRQYEDSDMDLAFTVFDAQRNDVTGLTALANSDSAEQTTYGINRLELNVDALSAGSYVLEVSNLKGEKAYLRFNR